MFGIVNHKKSTRGALIVSSEFSSSAKKFAEENHSIELIDGGQFARLLNLNLGPMWPVKRDKYFMNQKRKRVGKSNE
jgi:restriction endonuclease Mrr